MYQERFYRKNFTKGWFSYEIVSGESDILVKSKRRLDERFISDLLNKYRKDIQDYIERFPEFKSCLSRFPLKRPAPKIVEEMIERTSLLDVGPMASVAGAIAEYLGKELLKFSDELLVENGGDIFIKKEDSISLGLYAGEGSFLNDLTLQIESPSSYLGICSSSSFLGHSLSLGSADLAVVVSTSATFSDALATKLANMVYREEDIQFAIDYACNLAYRPEAVLILKREKVGLWGNLTIRGKK